MTDPNPPDTVKVADPGVERPFDRANAEVEWDQFDSAAYFEHNYGSLRNDDKSIIRIVADFFASKAANRPLGRAIDVGSGTNLYPALTMLPYASEVTLFERAFSNRQWLIDQLAKPYLSWTEFWGEIAGGRTAYAKIQRPLEVLDGRAEVVKGNVFSIEQGRYDLGTMFFVAESITTRTDEFQRAARLFVGSLKPGSPFAAAFMQNSAGYLVGDQFFPACSIGPDEVAKALAPVARNVKISPVDSSDLREGYCGMMVATGFKK